MKFEKPVRWPRYVRIDFLISWYRDGQHGLARIRIDLYSRSATTNDSCEWKLGLGTTTVSSFFPPVPLVYSFFFFSSFFFFFFLFFVSSPSLLFRPLVRPKKWRVLHRRRIDCSLVPRYTDIQLIILVHTVRFRHATKAWIDGQRRSVTERARQYVFHRWNFSEQKLTRSFFQLEPRNFNFELASQRGPTASSHLSLSSNRIQLIIASRIFPNFGRVCIRDFPFFSAFHASSKQWGIYNPTRTRCLDSR